MHNYHGFASRINDNIFQWQSPVFKWKVRGMFLPSRETFWDYFSEILSVPQVHLTLWNPLTWRVLNRSAYWPVPWYWWRCRSSSRSAGSPGCPRPGWRWGSRQWRPWWWRAGWGRSPTGPSGQQGEGGLTPHRRGRLPTPAALTLRRRGRRGQDCCVGSPLSPLSPYSPVSGTRSRCRHRCQDGQPWSQPSSLPSLEISDPL